jgi:hypothetical protein
MREAMGGVWTLLRTALAEFTRRARLGIVALALLLALAPTMAVPAIFDDGNDRKFVRDLRAKDPANLTVEEMAILAAADKVGIIRLCDGKTAGTAFYVNYGGRPAVVTSGHMFVDRESGGIRCGSKQARTPFYYPNTSYYDPERKDAKYPLTHQPLVYPPINLEGIGKH